MKKFIYHFCFYIGLLLSVFNPAYAQSKSFALPLDEEIITAIQNNRDKPLIEADNEFVKIFAVIMLTDKLYPEEKINGDITGFLSRVWPNTDIDKLEWFSKFVKTFVMMKRRYVYVVDGLRKKVKANAILPEDAPIIAKDGEFAPKYSEEKNTSQEDEYTVRYTPYKYLGYDPGEYGEPVRLRDKNYEQVKQSVLDEILLAVVEMDVGAFYRALKKIPPENDGTREKAVELGNGVRSRLLLDLSGLGDAEKIKGMMEVYIPNGWYANGDFLNPRTKPKFYLSEDTKEDLNIKEYELFYPDSIGVVNNGRTRHIWVRTIRFPMTFTRRDINKGITIKGNFTFELCKAKTDECRQVISQNRLSVDPSDDLKYSIHSNYITLGFAHLPQERTKHAELKNAIYNAEDKTLTVKFKTDKTFSNVAAMAEDAAETSFLKPRYTITEDEVSVTFDAKTLPQQADDNILNATDGGDLAVTAAFDEYEVLRTVIKPQILQTPEAILLKTEPNYGKAFLLGFLITLMPGILYLLQRLLGLIIERDNRRRILIRYAFGSATGIILLGIYCRFLPWQAMYENAWLIVSSVLLGASYLVGLIGYMDFNLFRPLKGKVRRGFFIGLFTIILFATFPVPFKSDVLDTYTSLPLINASLTFACIWCGVLILPILGLLFYKHIPTLPLKMQFINIPYTAFYIISVLAISYSNRGWYGLTTLACAGLIISGLWYIYPLAIVESTRYARSLTGKTQIFSQVQKHAGLAVIIIWLLSSFITHTLPLKNDNLPDVADTLAEINKDIEKDQPVLFILMPSWSPQILHSYTIIENLQNTGVKVMIYKTSAYNKTAKAWLKAYEKNSPPLNILFTKRHPRGLVLPTHIKELDWREAMSDFIK